MDKQHQLAIIGGGTAGIMTATQLLKKNASLYIAIIDPAETHYYQPAWTLVGAGAYDYKNTARSMASLIPKSVTWVKDFVTSFQADEHTIDTENSGKIGYEFLVVAPGLVMDPSLIEGLTEAMEKGIVCSNYTNPEHTWETIKNFKGGNALFTQPTTPIKCGGAPQKIAYLAADYFRKSGVAKKTNVIFATPGSVIFGVPVEVVVTASVVVRASAVPIAVVVVVAAASVTAVIDAACVTTVVVISGLVVVAAVVSILVDDDDIAAVAETFGYFSSPKYFYLMAENEETVKPK